jgi:ATP-binding cassette, subfamily F, member 3
MSLISLHDISFDFGREPVLYNLSLNILSGRNYGLAGGNGCGKSTLLSVIAGSTLPVNGKRQLTSGTDICLLNQDTTFEGQRSGLTLFEAVANRAFARIQNLEKELSEIANQMSESSDVALLASKHSKLQNEYEQLDGYNWQSKLEATLDGLGLDKQKRNTPVESLSGGEKRRAALASVLLSNSNLLLLDEPTNHLDLPSCEWLESWISKFRGTTVIVSHDRYFLDRVTDTTLHLVSGKLTSWKGNYSRFLEQYQEYSRQQEASWQKQQEKKQKTEVFIRKNIAGQKTKQAQSRRKQLEKLEFIDRPEIRTKTFKLKLQSNQKSGAVVMETKDLSFGFEDNQLFENVNFMVHKGDRIGIIGPNGCGKTTLLDLLSGKRQPQKGIINWGHNVDIGCYDQQLRDVTDSNTLFEEIAKFWPGASIGQNRSFAGAFGFGSDMIDRLVGRLSGGERARLSLMKLIKGGHNTLFLDEPTNHLDSNTREALEKAIIEFDGTLIVVSHDRRFLDHVVKKLFIFDDTSEVKFHAGNYSDYIRSRKEQVAEVLVKKTKKPKPVREGMSKNEIKKRQNSIEECEVNIETIEKEIDEVVIAMSDTDVSNKDREALGQKTGELQQRLNQEMNKWEKLNEEIDR